MSRLYTIIRNVKRKKAINNSHFTDHILKTENIKLDDNLGIGP